MKTAGTCILDTDGLDNELSVCRCRKSFGSLINHSVSNISTPKTKPVHTNTVHDIMRISCYDNLRVSVTGMLSDCT